MNKPDLTPAPIQFRALYFLLFLLPATIILFLAWPAALAAQEPSGPATTPDADTGLQIFAERCATCHGPLGLGDGEMADQLPKPPASLGSEEVSRRLTPAHVFETVTNGIISSGMPPFGPASSNSIDEANRWNLVAAVYSLGTPADSIEAGQAIYEESCAACHGDEGVSEDFDLTQQSYWLERSDEEVFTTLSGATGVAHDGTYDLSETELWDVVHYARTFTYDYSDPQAAFAPIEAASITGTVVNETKGSALPAGVPAVLNAFTADFTPSLTMTTTLDAGGSFDFTLTQVPPDLAYVVTVEHEGIRFGSDFGSVDRDDPVLQLPVTVYDTTTDASTIAVDQLHLILEFGDGQVQVNELYQFSQNAQAVFVGETGDPDGGTVEVVLPEEAADPTFDRSFGGVDSFFPAEDVIASDGGWADTVAVRPGRGALNLLVRYTLPYESGMEIAHPVNYDVNGVNLVLADAGVTLVEEAAWDSQGPQSMSGATFLNYTHGPVASGGTVAFSLQGEPQAVADPSAGVPAVRDDNQELVIGSGALLLALAIAAYLIRLWQRRPAPAVASSAAEQREQLLYAIAELDDAYEAGTMDEETYLAQRQELKEELAAVWDIG